MPFGFDPRKLVQEDKELEKNKEKKVINEQLDYDEQVAATEARIERQKSIQAGIDMAEQAIRETKFMEKEGIAAWAEKKKELDPEFELPDPFNLWKDTKSSTVESEYADKEIIKPEKDKVLLSGAVIPLEVESTEEPFESEVGVTESIAGALLSGSCIG